MSKKTIEEFVEELKVNRELQQKLSKINTSDEASFIKILNEAGYDFTMDEWDKYVNQKSKLMNEKLSDDELNQISGGLFHIDLCPKKFDSFLCQKALGFIGGCSHAKHRQFSRYDKNDAQVYYDYGYCDLGYWDEETVKGF